MLCGAVYLLKNRMENYKAISGAEEQCTGLLKRE
jgi:hypothetical protein